MLSILGGVYQYEVEVTSRVEARRAPADVARQQEAAQAMGLSGSRKCWVCLSCKNKSFVCLDMCLTGSFNN